MNFPDILDTGSLDDIANWLDTQTADDRLAAIQRLNKQQQRALFEKCQECYAWYFCAEPMLKLSTMERTLFPHSRLFKNCFVRLDDERVIATITPTQWA